MPPKRSRGGGGGKGKKKKGKPLTDEEKAKVQAQKALAEREKIARRQKLTKAFLDIKKEKEYELLKVNNNKILDLWRPILRKQKIKELLDDYKLMQLAFQRAFEKKNVCIEEMEHNLEKNEGEYDTAVDMHLHNIDKMMEFYRKRLGEVKESFVTQRNKLVDSLSAEKQAIADAHERSLQRLRDNMAGIERDFKQDAHESKVELYMKEEDLRNSIAQEVNAYKLMMSQKITNMWDAIHKRILSYEQTSNDKRKEYKKYLDRDVILSGIIDGQYQRLNALKDGIMKIDGRMFLFHKAFGKYIDELKGKKAECRQTYHELLGRKKYLIGHAKDKIQHLAICSHNVIERMDNMLTMRERVLRAIERCRKEEREEEKIDPFLKRWGIKPSSLKAKEKSGRGDSEEFIGMGDTTLDPAVKYNLHVSHPVHALSCDCDPCTCHVADQSTKKQLFEGLDRPDDDDDDDGSTSSSDADRRKSLDFGTAMNVLDKSMVIERPFQKLIHEFNMLEIFWLRYNKVTLEKESLAFRRKALLEDNHNLRLTLRNYMGSLNPPGLDLIKFTNELAAKDKVYFQKCMHAYELERKRKERCRKVGGVKVF